MKMLRMFNTRLGNFLFLLMLQSLRPFLKNLIAFSGGTMPKIDLADSIRNFEKVEKTVSEVKTDTES